LLVSSCALIFTICGFALVRRLSFINCWSLVNVHPIIYNSCALIFAGVLSIATLPSWWLYYVLRYTLSSKATFGSYLLLVVFYFVIYTLNFSFELLVLSLVSMISTFMVSTIWIVSSKLIIPIENNLIL
jgi:hypothetical protein